MTKRFAGMVGCLFALLEPAARAQGPQVDAGAILGYIKVLASDAFEGRAPGTPGEDKTVAYLTEQLKALGLAPGNPDGTYVQDVPLVGFQVRSALGTLRLGDKAVDLHHADDWVAVSRRVADKVAVEDSEVVFVGHGVVAPEYGWDDYKGLDVRGKTLLMLINDPPAPDPADPSKLDEATFKGKAMTYYGRWTYKYEIASEKGAAAAIIVHETGPAGYGFEVVRGSWTRENFDIVAPDREKSRVAVESWVTLAKADEILKASGQDFETLKAAARTRAFRPVSLGLKAKFEVNNAVREVRSRNVIGRLEGSDPKLRDEHVIYTAHWDHLGREPALAGDPIFNGAADNASGVATVLEIARGFSGLPTRPKRSIAFLFITAEEKGLLGAKFYATHPLYPLERTLANINLDVVNLWGRTSDLASVGLGLNTLDDLLVEEAAAKGRTVIGDPEPEKGMYYRSDHFEFAKEGVPALNAKGGMTYPGKPPGYGQERRDQYTRDDYHKVSDEVKPDWDLAGAAEDAALLLQVGRRVADGESYPEWKPGAEFKARRDAMLKRP